MSLRLLAGGAVRWHLPAGHTVESDAHDVS
jgi:hypothetical protein